MRRCVGGSVRRCVGASVRSRQAGTSPAGAGSADQGAVGQCVCRPVREDSASVRQYVSASACQAVVAKRGGWCFAAKGRKECKKDQDPLSWISLNKKAARSFPSQSNDSAVNDSATSLVAVGSMRRLKHVAP